MKRIPSTPRDNWQKRVEDIGFGFHSTNTPYWDESVYYQLSMAQVEQIEAATADLWERCLEAVQYVIDRQLFHQFHIPEQFVPKLIQSWERDEPAIYGRFDFVLKDGQLKLLEFNADTPTSLYEAGVVQWFWLQDIAQQKDQFNSIHEKLIAYWSYLKPYLNAGPLHFTCVKGNLEDLTTTEYLEDTAIQAGLTTKLVFIDDIGWDTRGQVFVDMEAEPISNLFKLYPWEWLVHEEFAQNMLLDRQQIKWIEPMWKMLLSNKAILPILHQLFPDHPNLLKAYFEPKDLVSYAKKPILSREGANVTLVRNGQTLTQTSGEYGEEGHIYQELFELPDFDKNFPLIGSWVIGQEPAGIGIREANDLITGNTSRFVPHVIGE